MTKIHSKASKILWNAIDLSDDADTVDFPRTKEEAEVTTLASTAKEFVVGLDDNMISLSGSWGAAVGEADRALADDFAAGTARTWIYRPAGTGSGNIEYTGSGYLTKYNVTSSVSAAVKWSADIRITGAVTRTVL